MSASASRERRSPRPAFPGRPNVVTIFDVGESAGRPVHRHGVPRRRLARRSHPRGRRAAGSGARLARAGRGRARRRARGGRRSPRREAREPAAGRRRQRARRRLRDRERRRDGLADEDRNGDRHGRVPLARAGSRRAGDAGERPLRARRRRLGAPHRPAPVRRRHAGRRGCGARARGRAADRVAARRPAGEARRGVRPRAREGPGGPVPLRRGVRRSAFATPCTRGRRERKCSRRRAVRRRDPSRGSGCRSSWACLRCSGSASWSRR